MHELFAAADGSIWVAVLQIIFVDILLGGDNAVVIALACRRLPERQRRQGIVWGVAGAVGLRIALTFFAVQLLTLPYLKVIGAVLLLWIGVQLLLPELEEDGKNIHAADGLFAAVRTIIVADLAMSLDNVLAVAAVAQNSVGLVVFGLAVSVPIIVWGAQFVLRLMDRFPAIVTLGGMLLGWIAGDMAISDQAFKGALSPLPYANYFAPAAGAMLVMAVGTWLAGRMQRAAAVEATGGDHASGR